MFKQIADRDPTKSPRVAIVDCAQGGQAMAQWVDPKANAWRETDRRLAAASVSPKQVQVVEVRRSFRREAGKRVEPVAARGEPVLRGQQAFGSPRRGRKIGLAPLPSLGQLADRTRDLVHVLDRAAFGFGVLLTRHG